jgi:hypothetical protein
MPASTPWQWLSLCVFFPLPSRVDVQVLIIGCLRFNPACHQLALVWYENSFIVHCPDPDSLYHPPPGLAPFDI